MEKEPTKKRGARRTKKEKDIHGQAVRFMLDVINATIYSSGEDYQEAVVEFFPQLQALGHLIGAADIDEVSAYLRHRSHW